MECRWRCSPIRATRLRLIVASAAAALLVGGCGGSEKTADRPSGGRPDGLVSVRSESFRSRADGRRISALFALPRGVRSRGCVLWQPGHGSTKQDAAAAWQGLAAIGLSTFSIDLRYEADGQASPAARAAVLNDPARFRALVRRSLGDLRSAVDHLERRPECERTVVFGGLGLGGGIGTLLAAEDSRIEAVVLIETPGSWRQAIGGRPQIDRSLDPARSVGWIAPRPVLILADPAARDGGLEAAARQPKVIVPLRKGEDAGSEREDSDAVASFLLQRVVEPKYGFHGRANGTFFERF